MAKRQLLIVQMAPSSPGTGAAVDRNVPPTPIPLGSAEEVVAALSNHNIAPDSAGGSFLYGPGLTMQLPQNNGQAVLQLLCSLIDEDLAWPVLFRMCQLRDWSMMDPDSGRVLHLSADPTT